MKGTGNQQDYGMRIYDPRLGKFLSVAPITSQYPELTPYQFASNTPIHAIDLDGLEGWDVKNKWSPEYVMKFRAELNQKISQYEAAQTRFTCDDLGLEVAMSFAKSNNLPFIWNTGSGTFDASSTKYKDYSTFSLDVKAHSGAPDFANDKNTSPTSYDNIKIGTLVVMTADKESQPNHIQVVTRLNQDEGVLKGYNAAQGNFNSLGRYFGSDDPESIRYLGVPVEEGYYSKDLDSWMNHSKGTITDNFFEDHYQGQYRDFDFENMNTNANDQPK